MLEQKHDRLLGILYVVASVVLLFIYFGVESWNKVLTLYPLGVVVCNFFFLISLDFSAIKKQIFEIICTGVGVCLLLLLYGLSLLFPSIVNPMFFSFIPLFLIAYGIIHHEVHQTNEPLLKRKFLVMLIITAISVPFMYDFGIVIIHLHQIQLQSFFTWMFSYGIIHMISLASCIVLAYVSIKKGTTTNTYFLFSLMCILWALLNFQTIVLILLPAHSLYHIKLLNQICLVNLIGISAHLFFSLVGKGRSKVIILFYLISFALIPLTPFEKFFSHALIQFPSGPYARPDGVGFNILLIAIFIVMIIGTIMSYRFRQSQSEPVIRRQYSFILSGQFIAVLLCLGGAPVLIGHGIYPFLEFAFVFLILIALGIFYPAIFPIRSYFKQRLVVNSVKFIETLVYISLTIGAFYILKDFDLNYIFDRITPYSIPALLSFICAAFISIIIIGIENNRTEILLLSIISLCYATLNLDILLIGIINDPLLALRISRIDHIFLTLFLGGCHIHLLYLVTGKKSGWWLVYLMYAFGAIMAILTQTKYYIQGMYTYYWGFFAKKAFLYDVMSSIWMVAFFFGIYILLKEYRRTGNPHKKNTLKYVLLGFLSAAALSLTNTPALYGYEIYPMGTFSFIPLLFLAYGLLKYNLYIALQHIRTAFFWLGLMLFLLPIGLIPWVFVPQGQEMLRLLIGIIIVAALFNPVRKIWLAVLNLFIRSYHDDLQKSYTMLMVKLSQTHHIAVIYQILSDWSFRFLKSASFTFAYYNKNEGKFRGWSKRNTYLSKGLFSSSIETTAVDQPVSLAINHSLVQICNQEHSLVGRDILEQKMPVKDSTLKNLSWLEQAEIVVPVFSHKNIVAMLVLGIKVDGFSFSRREKELLSELGHMLSPYIHNAQLFENLEDEVKLRTENLNLALAESRLKEKEISQNNETILRQNQVFLSLLETTSLLQQFQSVDSLFSFILQQLNGLFADHGFGIILEGNRPGILENAAFIGLEEREQSIILEYRTKLLDNDIDRILREKIDTRVLEHSEISDQTRKIWNVFPMHTRGQKVIGKLIIKGPALDKSSQDLINVFLGQVSGAAQNRLLMIQMEKMVRTDGLTGVYNRSYFNQEHQKSISNAHRFSNIAFSIMIVDINGLKRINDSFGHETGDQIIINVAKMLKSLCRETDVVTRFGGDEFAILLPSSTYAQSENVIGRIRKDEQKLNIESTRPDGTIETIPIRVSIGLASSEETEPEKVFTLADRRMYIDKQEFYEVIERYR
ncbi:MAG: sensor domain-containing diguanylate cyclase [Deltaproteobacteria bacterium]|nr:sensor domain-containing diguanylate cyclase [Deltaproteobacteria bacterium]